MPESIWVFIKYCKSLMRLSGNWWATNLRERWAFSHRRTLMKVRNVLPIRSIKIAWKMISWWVFTCTMDCYHMLKLQMFKLSLCFKMTFCAFRACAWWLWLPNPSRCSFDKPVIFVWPEPSDRCCCWTVITWRTSDGAWVEQNSLTSICWTNQWHTS